MAGELGDMTMRFGGDDRDFQKVADSVERRAKDVAQQLAGGSAGESLLKIGRLYYANVIGEGLKRMGDAAAEFSQKIRLGTASTGDLIEKVAEGIPYIGGFISAGRGIRELITGETAYVEVLKQQTAEQEKHITLINGVVAGLRAMQRAREDATAKANFNAGDSPFAFLFGQTVKGGERASDDAREKLKKENEKLLEQINDDKVKTAAKIQNTIDSLRAPQAFGGGGTPVVQPRRVDPEDDPTVKDLRKHADFLEKEAARIRQEMAATNAATENLIGKEVFTKIASLVGEKFVGAFDAARASLDRYAARLPQAIKETEKLVAAFGNIQQRQSGNIGQFLTEQNALGMSRAAGMISADQFKQLTDKSKFDQVARSIGSIFQQYAPILEMVGRLTDSNFGAGFRKIFGALGQVPGLFPGSIAEPKPFQASFVGLEDLGKRIQAAAVGDKSQKDPVQDGILRAAQDSLKVQQDQLTELKKNKPATVQ